LKKVLVFNSALSYFSAVADVVRRKYSKAYKKTNIFLHFNINHAKRAHAVFLFAQQTPDKKLLFMNEY
jgi:hypothetical protein